jgi:hypothetical protein
MKKKHRTPPPPKIETGSANRWEILIANHLDKSLWLANQNQGAQIMFITLVSSRCTALLRFLPASANRTNMQKKNHFPEPNQHMLTFLHPTLMFRVTYWAPVGMLLRASPLTWYMDICQCLPHSKWCASYFHTQTWNTLKAYNVHTMKINATWSNLCD